MRWRSAVFAVYWLAAFMLLPTDLAWGYIDPATTTYLIQIAAAIVITLGVSLGVLLYKLQMIVTKVKVSLHAVARKMRNRRMRFASTNAAEKGGHESEKTMFVSEEEALARGIIDFSVPVRLSYPALGFETSNAPHVLGQTGIGEPAKDGAQGDITCRADSADRPASKRQGVLSAWLWADQRTKKERRRIALFVAAAVPFTFIIFGMLDSVIQNEAKMNFSFAEIFGPIMLLGFIVFLVLLALLLLLRGRAFNLAVCLMLSMLIAGYLQSTFLNASVGPLMGLPLTWEELGLASVLFNLFAWILIFALIFLIGLSGKEKVQLVFSRLALVSSGLILAVQMVALLTVLPPVGDWGINASGGTVQTLTTRGMYEVSPDENIIVFVLDMLDEEFIEGVCAEDPGFFDDLDGFTRFTNNLSVYNATFPSVVNLMTGVPFDPHVTSERYIEAAYDKGSFVETIHEQGFSCNLYMEKMYTYSDGSQLEGYAQNIEETTFSLDTAEILTLMTRLTLLKSAPLACKAPLSIHPDDFRKLGASEKTGGADPYIADDPAFYVQLREEGLARAEGSGQFTYYHLNGSHYPFHMDANACYVEEETTGVEQTKGSFTILKEYFTQMKSMGIYKDATIVITGDHPTHLLYKTLDKPMLVGLFVKPAGEEGFPLRSSDAPVSLENLRATCVEAAAGDSSAWGETYFEVEEGAERERHYYNRFTEESTRTHHIAHYRVVGDARAWQNWELVELIPYDARHWF